MRTVWKYPLGPYGGSIAMPPGAKVLHLGKQAGDICLWVEVMPAPATEVREFIPVGTGMGVPDGGAYIGTVLLFDGDSLVLHFYEVSA